MWQQEFTWFFALFHPRVSPRPPHRLRGAHGVSLCAFFRVSTTPNNWLIFSIFLIKSFYAQLKDCSLYYIKEILVRFMVKQAVEHLKPALSKSAATQSRSGMTLSIDNSVIDRLGKLLRCTWSWYSGRHP